MNAVEIRKNAWGHSLPTPRTALVNPRLQSTLKAVLADVAGVIGVDPQTIKSVIEYLFRSAGEATDVVQLEQAMKRQLVAASDKNLLQVAIKDRSRVVFDHISNSFIGNTLLDVGCGNGLISKMAGDHFAEVQLLDVVNYVDNDVRFPFMAYREGEEFALNKTFDTVLLLTVLHHSNDPLGLLSKAWRATRKRLIIIESVFGVHEQSPGAYYALASLDEEDQIQFAVFVDWLYNRVLHDDIPVPYNFTTPNGWLNLFAENNMRVAEVRNLGQDIRLAPELHYLFVLER